MPATKLKNRLPVVKVGEEEAWKKQINGFYVHSNPPKVLQVNSTTIRRWLTSGDINQLEEVVLQGRGHELIGEYSPDPRVRQFLKLVPAYINKINEVHEAAIKGDVTALQKLVIKIKNFNRPVKNAFLSQTQGGVSPLHKAVYYGHPNVVEFLVSHFPQSVNVKDNEGRTALHYCGSSDEAAKIWPLLMKYGADARVTDFKGKTPSYYMKRRNTIILPVDKILPEGSVNTCNVESGNDLQIKPSNIRIWIHDRNLGKLQRIIWEGHGGKLLVETSNNAKVKRFLDGVPHILNAIKDVHSAAISGDSDEFVKSSSYPVPLEILGSKDANGLNPLHKAAGLGCVDVVQNILERNQELVNSIDNEGRTPLHYAAACSKNDDSTYKLLVKSNADETSLDKEGKTPAYYRLNPKELSKYLKVIPEAPRTSSLAFPSNWDWMVLQSSSDSTPTVLAPIIKRSVDSVADDLSQTSYNEETDAEESLGEIKEEPFKKKEKLETNLTKASFGLLNSDATSRYKSNANDIYSLEIESKKNEGESSNGEKESSIMPKKIGSDENQRVNGLFADRVGTDVGRAENEVSGSHEIRTNQTVKSEMDDKTEGKTDFIREEKEKEKEDEDEDEDDEKAKERGFEDHDPDRTVKHKVNEAIEMSFDDANNKLYDVNEEVNGNTEQPQTTEEYIKASQEEEVKELSLNQTREMTAWEIGEERQRLLDEGLVKINDGYEEEEEEAEVEEGKQEEEEKKKEDDEEEETSSETTDEIDKIILNEDMEGLASIVLNGDGKKLLGKSSANEEVQAFLENLPSYLDKIRAVHRAVRSGSLKDLQATLDRRRFAVAKESSDKLGVTPLHVAVLFRKPQIVKYLGGRFPETLNFKDNLGRTPLHYAAILPDNGHLFNLLLNLGADRKLKDNEGLTPGHYQINPGAMNHAMLLEEFDAPGHIARDLLISQENVLFGPDDGAYLADVLGSPLVKGLSDVANKRPKNPIEHLADFLYDHLKEKKERHESHEGHEGHEGHDGHDGLTTKELRVQSSLLEGNVRPPMSVDEKPLAKNKSSENKEKEEKEEEVEEVEDVTTWKDSGQASFTITDRDEFGQSILHFAAARTQGRTGLFQLIEESSVNLGYRDELYRTARDVAVQANIQQNINEIDKYVISLAARGETEKIMELFLEGYDHIVDLKDNDSNDIVEIASKKNRQNTVTFLKAIPHLEVNRERIHKAIRTGQIKAIQDVVDNSRNGRFAVIGKNSSGRCSLHIAILCQQKEITEYLAQKYPECLKIGDNLERTPMHYAMGVDEVESLSKILVKCGAKRISKDLKGRQPTYYFMNKSDISQLQQEENL